MLKFLIVTALVAFTSVTSASDEANGYLIARHYLTPAPMGKGISLAVVDPPALVCPAGAKGNICADDCKTLLACIPTSTDPIILNLCSDLSPSSTFCIPGHTGCSSTGDSSIVTCSVPPPVSCTNTGYFPDPTNCSKYYICGEDSVDIYECPPNYVYDGANYKCKSKRVTADCVTSGCTTTTANKYVVYSANKAYYAYCNVVSGVSKPIMFRCDDTANFQFNPTTVSCEFVCKAEGWYPDYTNCQNYYECYKSGTKLLSNIISCPSTYIFDVTQSRCVKGACATTPAPVSDDTTTTV